MTDVLLTVGTRKGLFIGRRHEGNWKIEGPHFNAQAIYSVAVDTRGSTPRLLAGGDSAHWGRPSSTPTTWARAGSSRSAPA
ncbi:hypothetical protein SMICM17S_05522 [Streptomyces microflavus]